MEKEEAAKAGEGDVETDGCVHSIACAGNSVCEVAQIGAAPPQTVQAGLLLCLWAPTR